MDIWHGESRTGQEWIGSLIKNLKKRNIEGLYCRDQAEAQDVIAGLVPDGASVSLGRSVTLRQLRLKELLLEKNCRLSGSETVFTDFFFMSTNGITEAGELVNIDETGARLSRMLWGPKQVVILAGLNKIASDVPAAIRRIREEVCPVMALAGGRNTVCATQGRCGDCLTPDSMCCQFVVTRRSGQDGRMKLILVGETLGY